MALELVGGAIVGELLKAVLDAKNKASSFQPVLARLESTLNSILPRLDEINRLNSHLNPKHPEMAELACLINNGRVLVVKCSKISTINFVKKVQYSKELLDLDCSLLRYFNTILSLDHFKNTKEILIAIKELQMKAGIKDGGGGGGGGVCNNHQSESSAGKQPKEEEEEDLESQAALEAMTKNLLQDDSGKEAAVKLYKNSKKKAIVKANPIYANPVYVEINNKSAGKELKKRSEESIEDGTKDSSENPLFLFEWCPYKFNLADILSSEAKVLGKGTYGTNYWCNTKYGAVGIKRLKPVKVGEMEFEQQIKDLGKFGQHPNVLSLLGYYSSKSDKFLIHAHLPMGSLSACLHEARGASRTRLNWISRMKIALGTARGISHLHSEGGVNFIHGNINSSSVLLTPDMDGCISDYGLAPLVNVDAIPPQEEGYHAPEVPLPKKVAVSQSSDVYSFGIVLLEIITGQRPGPVSLPRWIESVDRKEWYSEVPAIELLRYYNYEEEGYFSSEEEVVRITEIAMMCVDSEAVRRPKMHDVVRMIETIQPCT